jgi:hypothetical protein
MCPLRSRSIANDTGTPLLSAEDVSTGGRGIIIPADVEGIPEMTLEDELALPKSIAWCMG